MSISRTLGQLARCFCLAAVAAASLPAVADQLADVKSAGTLTVATEMQFVPFDFIKDGEYQGFDKDLMLDIGKELGVKIKFIDLPWPSILPGLDAKKFDLVTAPVIITKQRMALYRFTLPISDSTVAFLKRAGDKDITKPADVAGKNVGAQRGTSQLAQLRDYGKTLPKAPDVHEYVDMNQAYADLANGRLQAVVGSLPNVAAAAKERPTTFAVVQPSFGVKTYYAFVARKGDDSASLVKAIDDAMLAITKDGRMAALQKKWFGLEMQLPDKDFEPAL